MVGFSLKIHGTIFYGFNRVNRKLLVWLDFYGFDGFNRVNRKPSVYLDFHGFDSRSNGTIYDREITIYNIYSSEYY